MDPLIKDTLAELKLDVKEGFRGVNEQIRTLVTRGEFIAVVERIDAQHSALRRDFDTHEGKTDGIVSESRADLAAATKRDDDAHESIRKEFGAAFEAFKASNRWAIGISITSVGILFTIITWLINNIP